MSEPTFEEVAECRSRMLNEVDQIEAQLQDRNMRLQLGLSQVQYETWRDQQKDRLRTLHHELRRLKEQSTHAYGAKLAGLQAELETLHKLRDAVRQFAQTGQDWQAVLDALAKCP